MSSLRKVAGLSPGRMWARRRCTAGVGALGGSQGRRHPPPPPRNFPRRNNTRATPPPPPPLYTAGLYRRLGGTWQSGVTPVPCGRVLVPSGPTLMRSGVRSSGGEGLRPKGSVYQQRPEILFPAHNLPPPSPPAPTEKCVAGPRGRGRNSYRSIASVLGCRAPRKGSRSEAAVTTAALCVGFQRPDRPPE